jgi:hypothetical protein
MKYLVISLVVILSAFNTAFKMPTHRFMIDISISLSASNVDLFSNDSPRFSSTLEVAAPTKETSTTKPSLAASVKAGSTDRIREEASRLRKEAEDLESALRDQARANGISEEMINQFLPARQAAANAGSQTKANPAAAPKEVVQTLSATELRAKLGYLPIGEAQRMSALLEQYKAKELLIHWNSQSTDESTPYQASNSWLTAKTSIDPIKLRLDDVGYNYQAVLLVAIATGTILALASSSVGGQLGFFLGYGSALIPIMLVGIGSIAPALIGELILRFKMLTSEEAKERFIRWNAGKFVVGYILGLPIARFNTGGFSNTAEFFQLKPPTTIRINNDENESSAGRKMFGSRTFSQKDIAPSTVVCLAGAVAECIEFGEASGANAADVNILYELMNSIKPPLPTDKVQDHIRWAAVTAYEILSTHPQEYKRVIEAFRTGLPLEECIAALEGKA